MHSGADNRSAQSTAARKAKSANKTPSSAKQVDPALRKAVQQASANAPLTVFVKLDSKNSRFGRLPVSNRPGNAREREFSAEVEAEVQSVNADLQGDYRILSTAANIGVATVQASAGIVRDLMHSGKIAGMKLKAN
jgi:hypothetical protein